MPTPALLVIDVQQALCSGPYAALDADAMIVRINSAMRRARAAQVPVILIQHEASDGVLDADGEGWQLAAGLEADAGDLRLRKAASDAFHGTPLETTLRRLGVDSLVVCGLQSDFCVDSTVRRALALGFPVTLIADGHSTMDNGILSAEQIVRHHTWTLACLDSFGPRVTPVAAADLRFDAPHPAA